MFFNDKFVINNNSKALDLIPQENFRPS